LPRLAVDEFALEDLADRRIEKATKLLAEPPSGT
jgi:hypothetical protein